MLAQKVEDIIQSVAGLRPMPANVSRLVREIDQPEVSIRRLSELISLDQALAAHVLQMSNSASLGYPRTCSTLYEGIMHIGLGRLKSILLSSSASDMMQRQLNGYRLGEGELWHHSLVTAVAAEWLAQALRYPNPEEAYVSGLLHDIGKLLLDQFVLSNYSRIVEVVQRYQLQLWQAEEKLIGIDHARVGGLIAERWNFPVRLVDAIRCHHAPSFARTSQQLPAIVNLANSFAEDYQLANTELFSFQLHPESLNILKIDATQVEKLRTGMKASGLFPNFSAHGKSQ
ncbi:MAG TPA: HDOD domain-containing protein [Anaerolineales bacterium]|nr:HDOD domain-containing protein [Anaerolineales bacterium]